MGFYYVFCTLLFLSAGKVLQKSLIDELNSTSQKLPYNADLLQCRGASMDVVEQKSSTKVAE